MPLSDGIADLVVMINLHHELVSPTASYAEAFRLLNTGGGLLVADWAKREMEGGPPQAVRGTCERILTILRSVGFGDIRYHEGLPRHNLITARTGS